MDVRLRGILTIFSQGRDDATHACVVFTRMRCFLQLSSRRRGHVNEFFRQASEPVRDIR
jgi:hypothetical protein